MSLIKSNREREIPVSIITREKLSGSTSGMPVKIAATATPGTTIHTAVASTTNQWDEVYVWVTNTSASVVNLTIEYGGVTDPDNLISKTLPIPSNSPPMPILTGQILQNALLVKMFASVANVLLATGYINRITN